MDMDIRSSRVLFTECLNHFSSSYVFKIIGLLGSILYDLIVSVHPRLEQLSSIQANQTLDILSRIYSDPFGQPGWASSVP